MTPGELFTHIFYESQYKTIGDDLQYSIQVIEDVPYLFFAGTNSSEDWKHNLKFAKTVYKNQKTCMKMHAGFVDLWKSANDAIMEEFISVWNYSGEKQPVIAGHSLGGAMALFAAEELYFRTGAKADVITYGCPKVAGDKKTAEYLLEVTRICEQYANANDFITYLPPLFGYKHVNRVTVGEKFRLFNLFNISAYHCNYDLDLAITYSARSIYMNPVYERVLEKKKESGLTWDEIASRAGIKVRSWMTGIPTQKPTDKELRAIAPVLNTTFEYLKYGTEEA